MRLNIKRFAIEASNDTKLTAPVSSTYKYTLTASFIENSTSTANNTSNITCTASIGAQYVSYNVSNGGTLEIYWHDNRTNNDTLLDSITVEQCGNGGGHSYGTKSVSATTNVTHKDDGTLSGYAKAVFIKNKTNSYIPASGEVSTSNTALTTIPRASSISATTANIGSNSTITINRASSSFTHTVTYSFNNGAVSGTVATKTSSTSLSLTLPTSLYAQIPNSSEINGTLTCITYNGNTEIGRSTGSIKATVPSTAKPTVTFSANNITDTDTVSKDTIKLYVQGKSKLQFNFAQAFSSNYSATLKLYTLKINGTQVYSDNQSTYTMQTPLPNTTNTYELIVTDSRGLTATTGEQTITAYAYSAPTCSISAERNSSTPSTVVITYSGNITNINNNNKNIPSFNIQYRQSGSSGSWTTVTGFPITNAYTKNTTVSVTGISDSNSFDFKITANDSYNVPATATVSIGTSATLINFNANGNTLAFGKASEISDTIEFNIKTKFLKNAEFTGTVNQIGTLNNLTTTDKTNVVSSINELVTSLTGIQTNNVLANGAWLMLDSQTVNLSQTVLTQTNGIVLVWSAYSNGTAQDWNWNFTFIPKSWVSNHAGNGITCTMFGSNFGNAGCKYVYVNNGNIKGHSTNNSSGTSSSGITFINGSYVLRYVVGV